MTYGINTVFFRPRCPCKVDWKKVPWPKRSWGRFPDKEGFHEIMSIEPPVCPKCKVEYCPTDSIGGVVVIDPLPAEARTRPSANRARARRTGGSE